MRTAGATISDLFGQDKFEVAKKKAKTMMVSQSGKLGKSAELILKDGTRRHFRSKAWDRQSAIKEILAYVAAVEELFGQEVVWRLNGEKTYYKSTNFTGHLSLGQKLMKFFFDI